MEHIKKITKALVGMIATIVMFVATIGAITSADIVFKVAGICFLPLAIYLLYLHWKDAGDTWLK